MSVLRVVVSTACGRAARVCVRVRVRACVCVCVCDFNIGEVGRELVEAVEAMYPSDPTSVADDVAMD